VQYKVNTAIISVGKNFYNHPTKEVLTRLDQLKIKYYRTDEYGSVSIKYYFKKRSIIKTFSPYNNNALK
jgi:beta-lactamase superfamily II metal-dependent hydrolase